MPLLNYYDLAGKEIVEVGCGTTFPSYKFYFKSKPKSVVAFELRELELEKIENFVQYFVIGECDEFILPPGLNKVDVLILSKFFNVSSKSKSRAILKKLLGLSPTKIIIEEYNVVSAHSGDFIGVDYLSEVLRDFGYYTSIHRNTRIFPEIYYEASSNLVHRIYNLFFCKRDVLVATKSTF